jgi:hypothetical protein
LAKTVRFAAARRNQLDNLILGALHQVACLRLDEICFEAKH